MSEFLVDGAERSCPLGSSSGCLKAPYPKVKGNSSKRRKSVWLPSKAEYQTFKNLFRDDMPLYPGKCSLDHFFKCEYKIRSRSYRRKRDYVRVGKDGDLGTYNWVIKLKVYEQDL